MEKITLRAIALVNLDLNQLRLKLKQCDKNGDYEAMYFWQLKLYKSLVLLNKIEKRAKK